MRPKPWMWKLTVPTVLVGSLVTGWFVIDARARRELATARAAFAAHGFPTRIDEIVPPPLPDEENADPCLREAWKIVSGSSNWENAECHGIFREIERLETPGGPGSSGATASAQEALARLRELATDPAVRAFTIQVRRATERRASRPALDYAKGPFLNVPHLTPERTMIRLLTKLALAHAQSAATIETAWEELLQAQTIADWADDTPMLIAHLTAVAGSNIVHESAVAVMASHALPGNADQFIARLLDSIAARGVNFERALHMERIAYIDIVEHRLATRDNWLHEFRLYNNLPPWVNWCDPWLTPVISPLARPRLAIDLARSLDFELECAILLHAPDAGTVPRLRALAAKRAAADAIVPDYLDTMVADLSARMFAESARQRALVSVLAAFREHARSGAWPPSPAQFGLPGNITTDPCSGHPLRLIVTADAITIYADGFDGDDDGGRGLDPSAFATGDGDIAVRVKLPPENVD